jgi:diketogulonate reductase-like aldo/keto reductase
VTPAINQIELHPYFPQAEQRAWDKAHGLVTQAWSPLGRANQLLQDPTIRAVADRLGKTIPQVILRWHVQLGAIPLPKAASEARQIEIRPAMRSSESCTETNQKLIVSVLACNPKHLKS